MSRPRLTAHHRGSTGIALLVIALAPIMEAACRRDAGREKTPARLEVVRVDDTLDPFDKDAVASAPEGISVQSESVRPRPGVEEVYTVRYAALMGSQGETLDSAVARVEPWTRTLRLPPGVRVAWSKRAALLGRQTARTYILSSEPIVTTADVVEAIADTNSTPFEPSVMVTLDAKSRERFASATRAWKGKRLATVVDAWVTSAAVIIDEVSGGQVMIPTNAGDDEAKADAARALARRLGRR